jgi:hypothetical protein
VQQFHSQQFGVEVDRTLQVADAQHGVQDMHEFSGDDFDWASAQRLPADHDTEVSLLLSVYSSAALPASVVPGDGLAAVGA